MSPVGAAQHWYLQRHPSTSEATIGEMTCDGEPMGYVLEDVVREVPGAPVSAWKVPGETAIPSGRYRVIVTESDRFGRRLPLLLDVPGFSGIRIHPGNVAANTEGCLLPGLTAAGAMVFRSRDACQAWQDRIETALLAGREVWITIENS